MAPASTIPLVPFRGRCGTLISYRKVRIEPSFACLYKCVLESSFEARLPCSHSSADAVAGPPMSCSLRISLCHDKPFPHASSIPGPRSVAKHISLFLASPNQPSHPVGTFSFCVTRIRSHYLPGGHRIIVHGGTRRLREAISCCSPRGLDPMTSSALCLSEFSASRVSSLFL